MSETHLKYHLPITRNGIYNNSVKLLLALSIYELLIAGLMEHVYQSDAYEVLPGVLVNRGKRAFIPREKRKNAKF